MTIHLLVKGKVQGVFFRVSARKKAEQLGIVGWVRNTKEKHVEIMARGTEEQLAAFSNWCSKGPSGARVDDVVQEPVPDEDFKGFSILH